jgi:hypothetical protein
MNTKSILTGLIIAIIGICLYSLRMKEPYAESEYDKAQQKRADERKEQQADIEEARKKSVASEVETKCMERAKNKKECKLIGDKLDNASAKMKDEERRMLYFKYQNCTGDEYNKCACEFKEDVMQACYNRMKDQKPGVVRGLGCYQTGMKEDDLKACLKDPVGYLCKKPDSQQCADVKSLCPNPCDEMEDLTKPILD